jgi:hypothetical protein
VRSHNELAVSGMLDDWIYNSPPWLSSSVFVLGGIVASGLVLVVLTRLVRPEMRHSHNEFTLFTVTNMAVLYAVLLAFIAIAAWEDLSKASDVVGTEASLVEDLYFDAQGIEDKQLITKLQKELRDYIHAVVDKEWPEQQAGRASDAASPALRDIRVTLAEFKPATSGDTIVMQEMLHSLNEVYNARRARLDAAAGHIPSSVWWVIGFLGVLIVGFTALAGMRNLWMHFVLLAGFTTAIVIVVALIVQLDYPFRGEISVSAEPFEHVLSEVGAHQGAYLPAGAAQ